MNHQQKQKLRQDLRDVLLVIGSFGIVASLFLMLASMITTIKMTKLAILGLLFASSLIFYQGLAPQVKKRLQDTARLNLKDYWQRLQKYRYQFSHAA